MNQYKSNFEPEEMGRMQQEITGKNLYVLQSMRHMLAGGHQPHV